MAAPSTAVDRFFAGRRTARRLFAAVRRAVRASGAVELRATRTQLAFVDGRAFAYVWTPDRWLSGPRPPLVFSIVRARRARSRGWKEVVEVAPGRWMHHRELWTTADLGPPVRQALRLARAEARRSVSRPRRRPGSRQ